MNANLVVVILLGVYLLIGGGMVATLLRRGQPAATALSALVAWPLLVSGDPSATPSGPYWSRIAATFEALQRALPGEASALLTPADLAVLRSSLERADQRIAVVDRLLADPVLAAEPSSGRLLEARSRAAAELEAVLGGVIQLRVSVGLLTLAGDTAGVRARLGELSARVRALEELNLG